MAGKRGYDLDLTAAVSERVSIPVIASGGVGTLEHLVRWLCHGKGGRGPGRLDFSFSDLYDSSGESLSAGTWRPGSVRSRLDR